MGGLTPSCRIRVNAAGDWQILPPAGQIMQIGDAGATSQGLVDNDDLFVSGKLEIDGEVYFEGGSNFLVASVFYSTAHFYGNLSEAGDNGSNMRHKNLMEQVTIAVGFGAAGVNTAANLAPVDSIITAVAVRVTQAPGGGAVTFNLGRTGGNVDEFIQNLAVALDTTGNSAANGDGVNAGPVHNGAANTLVLTTNANVIGTDMKVRILVYYRTINAPTY